MIRSDEGVSAALLTILSDSDTKFPDTSTALNDPNGLLCVGGDLSSKRLVEAYRRGIFPWYSEGQPILWWSPNPRCVISPKGLHVSKSLKKSIRQCQPSFTFDQCFDEVIYHCAHSRGRDLEGTWIDDDMSHAYKRLHREGRAHSLEVWSEENRLIGGLYGISIGKAFFGESMFSLEDNGSKMAFSALCLQLQEWQFGLIDCQVENAHLLSLGAHCIDRSEFSLQLTLETAKKPFSGPWIPDQNLIEKIMQHENVDSSAYR